MKSAVELGAVVVIAVVAGAFAWAAGAGLPGVAGLNPLVLIVGWSFAVQWAGFVQAWRCRSERYYDLVGSIGHLSAIALALMLSTQLDGRSLLLAALVSVWALRLGSFLFVRILAQGNDSRFDEIRHHGPRFLMAWTLQAAWIVFTQAAVLLGILSPVAASLSGLALLGGLCWLLGFGFEVIADRQKRRFRAQPENRDTFIRSGLWAWSRHPNYFGEIMMWFGLWLIALPALQGWQHLAFISPVFVYLLLTRISGIPLLEASAARRWGQQPAYQQYLALTPRLWPRRPR